MITRNETTTSETKVVYTSDITSADPKQALSWLASIIESEEISELLASGNHVNFNFDLQLESGEKIYFTVVGRLW